MQFAPEKKLQEAHAVIEKCIDTKGIWASPVRYKYQCWTRDFVIASEDLLLSWHKNGVVRAHLAELAKRQHKDGRVPIMFLDQPLPWLLNKLWVSLRHRRLSFLLRRYFSNEGIGQLSPWTKDSEILFIIGIFNYVKETGDNDFLEAHQRNIQGALEYIENNLMRGGLVFGGDWRDTRPELGDKFLLTNNCLLFRMYSLLGERQKAIRTREMIMQKFWTGAYLRDYIGSEDFEPLGNALAVLFNIVSRESYGAIFEAAEALDTPYGYKINNTTLPPKSKEEEGIMRRTNQFGVIWPFIHGFMILASVKAERYDLAKRQLEKWNKLDGFYEFYDPLSGKGHGSSSQAWSAALFLRAVDALTQADSCLSAGR